MWSLHGYSDAEASDAEAIDATVRLQFEGRYIRRRGSWRVYMCIIIDCIDGYASNTLYMADQEQKPEKTNQAVPAKVSRHVSFNTPTVQDDRTQSESPSVPTTSSGDSESDLHVGMRERSRSDAAKTVAGRFIVTRERKWSVSIASLVGAIPALLLGITLGYPSNVLLDLTGEATELQPEYFFSNDLMKSVFVVSYSEVM